MRRKVLNGILAGFLGTYTSRYSDHEGYWIFGMLFRDLNELKIDLLKTDVCLDQKDLKEIARELANRKFREQMGKAGLAISLLEGANLTIVKSPHVIMGLVNGRICPGHKVLFSATAIKKRNEGVPSK